MSDIDNPLKMLISEFAQPFAAWLLDTPVQAVRPLNVEFPARPVRGDLLFEVLTQQGRKHLLHVELQGRRSHQPMPYRQLEYMSQTALREIPLPLGSGTPRLHSVVFYVGEGAGREDSGRHAIYGLGDNVSLHWQYQVIRLWEMPAEALLQLEQPALAALVGLTQLQKPAETLLRALQTIRRVPDVIGRQRLLTALVALLPNEEVTEMVEKFLEESDELLLDTPYLRRMRELGWREGEQAGRQEGRQEGRRLGRQEGREEGIQAMRDTILEGVAHKFNPSLADYRQLQRYLEQIHQLAGLQPVLLALLDATEIGPILELAAATAAASGEQPPA